MACKRSHKLTRKTLKQEQSEHERLLNTLPGSLMEKYPSSVLIKKNITKPQGAIFYILKCLTHFSP